jgi:hypothetical protein
MGKLMGASLKRAGEANAYVHGQQSASAMLLLYQETRATVLIANTKYLYQLGFHG